jgi:hypothetical protein
MSIYDFTVFKNCSFSEEISYTVSGGTAKTIRAVVFRKQPGTMSGSKSDIPVVYYPVVIEIDKADIPTVIELEDAVVCADATGVSKTYRVKKIMYSDAGCYKLGLL